MTNIIDISTSTEVYSVSRLNREVRFLLESNFSILWIEGEISNFAAPQSGHWYFSLKDANAQVRCAMFRPQNRRLGFIPKDGMHVILKVRISLYEGRGEFQLLAEHLEKAGEGKLRQAFDALKKRLLEAGLFDPAYKKPLPVIPKSIGIITSVTGAAIHDILNVLKRRFPCASVIIHSTLVQGESAAPQIVKAIHIANKRQECDVIILARGGGSLEDLWPFNEEIVARTIFQSKIPIVSGIGHEVDFTIADFVADFRAPTPSAAAELVTPDKTEMLETIANSEKHFVRLIKQKITHLQQHLTWIQKHLYQQHPKRRLAEQIQQLDMYELTLIQLQKKLITYHQAHLKTLQVKLLGLTPNHSIRQLNQNITLQYQQLRNTINNTIQIKSQQLSQLATKLNALSPLATLTRGFAIATREHDQHILRSISEVALEDKIKVKLMHGNLTCCIKEKFE